MCKGDVFIPFPTPKLFARFIKREKRFLAHMELEDGTRTIAHCPNTGSMKTCLLPGARSLLWDSENPNRKLPYTWKAVELEKAWAGIDTILPNKLTSLAIEKGMIASLGGFDHIYREKPMGESSRVDLLLEGSGGKCFVEVKNVTMVDAEGTASFPDAVTARGLKHLRELSEVVRQGHRAAMVFVVQRGDGVRFEPAAGIDPEYALGLRDAAAAGVEIHVLSAEVSPEGVRARGLLPAPQL